MGANVLVDSSYFVHLLRSGHDPFERFTGYADYYDFLTCGVVMVEILRGLKEKKAHDRMAAGFACMLYVPTLNSVWDRVAKLAWQLDRKGHTMQVTDLVIAACALEYEAVVLTRDSDFQLVPGLQTVSQFG